MTKGKRKKDVAIGEIRAALERLLDVTEDYREELRAELEAARNEEEPYDHLIRALERQISSVQTLEELLEDDAWEQVIRLANGSAYVEHTRTRDYF